MGESGLLIIMPRFYTYSNKLKSSFQKKKIKCSLFYELPFYNIFLIVKNINQSAFYFFIRIYYSLIFLYARIKKEKEIFIIRGRYIPTDILKKFSEKNDVTIKIYQWDSFKNNPNAYALTKITNEFYSFDFEDCDKYNLKYVPLFFDTTISLIKGDRKYKCSFIGSFHGDRYEKLKTMKKNNQYSNMFFYLYISPMVYLKLLLKNKAPKYKDIKLKKMSYNNMLEILSNSESIIDIHSENQSGLTIRTYESLSLGCKVYTTNKYARIIFENSDMIEYVENLNEIKLTSVSDESREKIIQTISKYDIKYWLNHFGY